MGDFSSSAPEFRAFIAYGDARRFGDEFLFSKRCVAFVGVVVWVLFVVFLIQ